MKNQTNVNPYEKWNNTVIKIDNDFHGAKVVEFWKSVGINANGCGVNGIHFPYYGVFNGRFDNMSKCNDCKVITLEEAISIRDSEPKTFPREMYCWDNHFKYVNKEVIVYVCSDEELKKYNRDKKFIGFTSNYINAMEIEEYEAMMKKENENSELIKQIEKTEKELAELKNKLNK